MYYAPSSIDDTLCAVCKVSSSQILVAVQILTSKCGCQRICSDCLPKHFIGHARAGLIDCPKCGTPLQEDDFSLKTPEDLRMERQVQVRRQVKQAYNMFQSDFKNLRAYNDYLEEVEELIYNKVHGLEISRTKDKIEKYSLDNREQIARNRRKRDEERATWKKKVEDEAESMEKKRAEWVDEDIQKQRDQDSTHKERLHKIRQDKGKPKPRRQAEGDSSAKPSEHPLPPADSASTTGNAPGQQKAMFQPPRVFADIAEGAGPHWRRWPTHE
jgi:CDK-activating kinase assembly factor MAT1